MIYNIRIHTVCVCVCTSNVLPLPTTSDAQKSSKTAPHLMSWKSMIAASWEMPTALVWTVGPTHYEKHFVDVETVAPSRNQVAPIEGVVHITDNLNRRLGNVGAPNCQHTDVGGSTCFNQTYHHHHSGLARVILLRQVPTFFLDVIQGFGVPQFSKPKRRSDL